KKRAERSPQAMWMLSALESLEGGGSRVAATGAPLAPTPTLKDLPPVRRVRRAEPATLKDLAPVRSERSERPARSFPWRTAVALVVLAGAVTTGVTYLRRHPRLLVGASAGEHATV